MRRCAHSGFDAALASQSTDAACVGICLTRPMGKEGLKPQN